jgi:Fe-S-cluster containining protein
MLEELRNQNGPLLFFKAQRQAFDETLVERKGRPDLLDGLLSRAYSSFEVNAEIQSEGQPPLACHKGCATCCTLRVTATAPEVLMVARYIRATAGALRERGINLAQRVARADEVTRGLSERQRMAVKRQCPFIVQGCCVIYRVRPLACRGHASFDKQACRQAAAGKVDSIPYSIPHMTVRSLIQNALQSALRDAGLAWGSYELNQSVRTAFAEEDCFSAWLEGIDVFERARATEVSLSELESTYDAVKRL